MNPAFYERLGPGRYRPTEHTGSPWGPGMQHLGPPSALLTREMEHLEPRPGMALQRITIDVLGAVPITDVETHARILRPGRTVELVEAEMTAAGRPVVRARGWRIATSDTTTVATPAEPLPPPESATALEPPASWRDGYVHALDWRWLRSDLSSLGPGTAWLRLRIPIVDDEEPTHLQQLMAAADSANGVGSRISIQDWIYVNVDLTVHLDHIPASEWIGLDSETTIGPTGAGVCATTIHESGGPIGRAAQLLTVRARRPDTTSTDGPVQ